MKQDLLVFLCLPGELHLTAFRRGMVHHMLALHEYAVGIQVDVHDLNLFTSLVLIFHNAIILHIVHHVTAMHLTGQFLCDQDGRPVLGLQATLGLQASSLALPEGVSEFDRLYLVHRDVFSIATVTDVLLRIVLRCLCVLLDNNLLRVLRLEEGVV